MRTHTALLGLAALYGDVSAAVKTNSGNAASATFGAYFANWAQYHADPYKHVASDLAPIAGRTDDLYFGFVYFCPPAGTSPMPYWAVTPYGRYLHTYGCCSLVAAVGHPDCAATVCSG